MNEISCTVMREAMLEAELDELRGLGESDVAQHVRTCAACGERAEILVRGHDKLAASLAAIRPRAADANVTPIQRKWRKLSWVPVPLAAAAVLTLLMIPQQNGDEELPRIDAIARMMFKEEPAVSPPPGKQAMVIEKKEMTIVWLYSQEKP
jgi:anti-sigma factor RsiW